MNAKLFLVIFGILFHFCEGNSAFIEVPVPKLPVKKSGDFSTLSFDHYGSKLVEDTHAGIETSDDLGGNDRELFREQEKTFRKLLITVKIDKIIGKLKKYSSAPSEHPLYLNYQETKSNLISALSALKLDPQGKRFSTTFYEANLSMKEMQNLQMKIFSFLEIGLFTFDRLFWYCKNQKESQRYQKYQLELASIKLELLYINSNIL